MMTSNDSAVGGYKVPVAELTVNQTKISYAAPNQAAYWRVSTFNTKEPETVKWIAGFQPGEVFVDIGANMGLYSLFAAVYSKAQVFAFEPESQNYALLNQNIRLNNMAGSVVAWCCALTSKHSIDRLYMSHVDAARSGHEFGDEVNHELKPVQSAFAQGCLGYALDDFVAAQSIPVPNHVKIDVDGFEHLVVEGALQTFANTNLRSVLIEISPHLSQHAQLIEIMCDIGFVFDPDQVERARRKEGGNKDYAEYIFRR